MDIKAIFHIDEEDKWPLLLGNVKNLLREADDAAIEVVANAVAVKGYVNSDTHFKTEMEAFAAQRVRFCACRNSLRSLNLGPDDLYGFVVVVPAGVMALVARQRDGYAYIKP